MTEPGDALSLYVHWPFCLSKCPYCDFNSHVAEQVEQERWRAALLRELDQAAAELPGRRLATVFFGGGTPSLMPPATFAAVLERAALHWSPLSDLEVTFEANPTSVEAARLAEFRAAGANRVSLGVQALDDAALKFLGRGHDSTEALAAVRLAARLFDRYSFDLIYARPRQRVADWMAELARALDEAGEHLSLYQLTIEPGTVFHTRQRAGKLSTPGDARAEALYDATQAAMERAGFDAYEISNHARPGGACRHNLATWRYRDYVGIGPGAHGRVTVGGIKHATRRRRSPAGWLDAVEAHGHGMEETVPLDPEARLEEAMLMGLRLSEGVPLARIAAESGRPAAEAFDPMRLDTLTAEGLIARDATHLRVTAAGRRRLDSVLGYLLT